MGFAHHPHFAVYAFALGRVRSTMPRAKCAFFLCLCCSLRVCVLIRCNVACGGGRRLPGHSPLARSIAHLHLRSAHVSLSLRLYLCPSVSHYHTTQEKRFGVRVGGDLGGAGRGRRALQIKMQNHNAAGPAHGLRLNTHALYVCVPVPLLWLCLSLPPRSLSRLCLIASHSTTTNNTNKNKQYKTHRVLSCLCWPSG